MICPALNFSISIAGSAKVAASLIGPVAFALKCRWRAHLRNEGRIVSPPPLAI